MSGRQGVAISTTGDEHRLGFLETTVQMWDSALSPGDSLFVTIDGDEQAHARVFQRLSGLTASIFRVGQPNHRGGRTPVVAGRQGVAANKNTGLELLMGTDRMEHLFLCDDDTYPWSHHALVKHTEMAERIPHSMVCWGGHRLQHKRGHYATWTWPRGVLLYATRGVVEKVGGMVEAFGTGGHEHAEWSRRIHQSGLTPAPFITPSYMAERGTVGPATRANVHWHCEDMKQVGERSVELGHRRKQITSFKDKRDYAKSNQLWDARDGNIDFVPYSAYENGRASATLCVTSTGRGAGGDL